MQQAIRRSLLFTTRPQRTGHAADIQLLACWRRHQYFDLLPRVGCRAVVSANTASRSRGRGASRDAFGLSTCRKAWSELRHFVGGQRKRRLPNQRPRLQRNWPTCLNGLAAKAFGYGGLRTGEVPWGEGGIRGAFSSKDLEKQKQQPASSLLGEVHGFVTGIWAASIFQWGPGHRLMRGSLRLIHRRA